MRSDAVLGNPLLIVFPLVIWGAHFLFAYAVTAIVCARPGSSVPLYGMLGVATVLALAGITGLGLLYRRRLQAVDRSTDRDFVLTSGVLASVVAGIAVAWMGLAMLFVPACE